MCLTSWLRGVNDFWHMLEIGLSLAIAAVPEGLPAVATMTLALGMQRMPRMRALVRRLTPEDRRRWEKTNQELAGTALRVLGLAYRELPDGPNEDAFGRDLVFVGLVGMSDPLRDEAKIYR